MIFRVNFSELTAPLKQIKINRMNQLKDRIPFLLTPGIMMILAPLPFPYGYYILLRLVVSMCSGILAFAYYKNSNRLYILFGLTVLLFNPLFKVYLDKALWAIIDLAIGGIYVGLGVREMRKK
jgi:hypothetical protein